MNSRDPIALITGAHGFGISAALIASLGGAGVRVVNLEDDSEIASRRHNRELLDRLDRLDMLTWNRSIDEGLPSRWDPPARREITFIDTPKPLSKRRARRLRGRAAA